MKIGDKIKEARMEKNLSVRSLAKEARIDNSYLSKIERNVSMPSIDVLYKIGQALDTPLIGLQMALLKNKEDVILDDAIEAYIKNRFQLDIDIKKEYANDCRMSELRRNISELIGNIWLEIYADIPRDGGLIDGDKM